MLNYQRVSDTKSETKPAPLHFSQQDHIALKVQHSPTRSHKIKDVDDKPPYFYLCYYYYIYIYICFQCFPLACGISHPAWAGATLSPPEVRIFKPHDLTKVAEQHCHDGLS